MGELPALPDLNASIGVPERIPVGENITVKPSVSLPELPGDYDASVTASLYVDGSEIASLNASIQDGATKTFPVGHVFETKGSHNLTLTCEAVVDQQTVTASASTTVNVTKQLATSNKVTRSLPILTEPNSNFNVTINSQASAMGAEVNEYIPSGFKFVGYSSHGARVNLNRSGDKLTFTATDRAADGFTINYTLQGQDNGTYTFSGTWQPKGGELKAIGGDNQLIVSPGETNPDNVPNDMEMVVSKYSDFNWAIQKPTKGDVVGAVTNAVGQYFSAKNPSKKSEIVDDVTQMVQLYFKLKG